MGGPNVLVILQWWLLLIACAGYKYFDHWWVIGFPFSKDTYKQFISLCIFLLFLCMPLPQILWSCDSSQGQNKDLQNTFCRKLHISASSTITNGEGQTYVSFTAVVSAWTQNEYVFFFHSSTDLCFTSSNSYFNHPYVIQTSRYHRNINFSQWLRFHMNGSKINVEGV